MDQDQIDAIQAEIASICNALGSLRHRIARAKAFPTTGGPLLTPASVKAVAHGIAHRAENIIKLAGD